MLKKKDDLGSQYFDFHNFSPSFRIQLFNPKTPEDFTPLLGDRHTSYSQPIKLWLTADFTLDISGSVILSLTGNGKYGLPRCIYLYTHLEFIKITFLINVVVNAIILEFLNDLYLS